ncbi:MAG: HAD-IIIA family hydrolase [Opitutaceae bacterium]|nr:HAD-IIIA family hydrolase [Opitutaceae bacterium]
MSKALFLDRDGTLILDKHYLADPAGVELIPGVAPALARARALGYRLFIVTNQSGVGRGYYTLDDVHRCNARMDELLGLPRPIWDGVCIAPESSDQPSRYRKPSPAYLQEMITEHRLDRAQCWMVGDRESDIDAGLNAQVNAAAVCTGKHDAAAWAALGRPGLAVFPDFAAFVATLR